MKAKGRRKAEGLKAKGWRQGRRGRSMPILEGEKQIRVEGREKGGLGSGAHGRPILLHRVRVGDSS